MLDSIHISVQSGKGGDGAVAARREAGVPFGGPAGGDGGKGGDVIFQASKDEQTLIKFRHHNHIQANDGQDGMIKDKYGANAQDHIVIVPVGTIVKDVEKGHILTQFTHDGQEFVVAKGGKGGAGNIHFKNAVNQYPNFALLGEPGQSRKLQLELQMLGDVGLIGTPSVGKSSLINSCCDTKVKTAEYHFTTLQPNIGICKVGQVSFSMVDIPGIVEGASSGKGLGNEFLRHILKSRIFALVVDMDSYELGFEKLSSVFDEIILYIHQRFVGSLEFGQEITDISIQINTQADGSVMMEAFAQLDSEQRILFQKVIHLVANKYDMVLDEEIAKEFIHSLAQHLSDHFHNKRGRQVQADHLVKASYIVSAATHYGIQQWIDALAQIIAHRDISYTYLFDTVAIGQEQHEFITDITEQDLPMLLEQGYIESSSRQAKVREIWDEELSRLVNILPWGNTQAEYRFWNVLLKKKYFSDFEKAGILHGDILKVMSVYSGVEHKYIMYV